MAKGRYILKLVSEKIESILWNKLYEKYKFSPETDKQGEWIKISGDIKIYYKDTPWTNKQENLINLFLENLVEDNMYAFDWQHDCFIFSPKEYIPYNFEYYDSDRKCQVYFPTYYPNGDYHLFFDKEWRNEVVIMGSELIKGFENKKFDLGIQ